MSDFDLDSIVGSVDLTEMDDGTLADVAGGQGSNMVGTFGCCWCVPWYSSWTRCGVICDGPKRCD